MTFVSKTEEGDKFRGIRFVSRLRLLQLLSLWWARTHYHGTQVQCDIQVTTIYLPQVNNQAGREDKQLGGLHVDCPHWE